MTPRLSALALALLLSPLRAQTTATATLHGTVLNSATQQPIARALVSLDQYGQATLTDNEGRFAFDRVPTGETTLSFRRPGFGDSGSNANMGRQTVSVASDSADVALELVPLSAITGELLLPGDDSPGSLQVQLLRQEIENGHGHWAMFRSVETNSEGRFRFGNLLSGAYMVHAAASLDPAPARLPNGASQVRYGYVPAFYPGVRDFAGAGIIHLDPGKQADVRMELTREPYYPVVIPVANADDARGISFEVSSDSFLGLGANFSPADGMVHIDLPAGHYLIEAQGFGQRALSGEKEFDVNPSSGQLPVRVGAITLLPVSRIPVVVRDEFTHTAVTIDDGNGPNTPTAANQVNLNLQRQGSSLIPHGRNPSLEDNSSSRTTGVSELVGAAPGKYWVNANPFNGYIAAITSGGVDLLQNALTVSPDGSASPIEVTLRDDTATISASLASNLISPGQTAHPPIHLELIPESEAAVERSVVFAADGTATLSGLPPGSYLAFAATANHQVEYRNPTVMAQFSGKGQTVTLNPGGTAHITIDSLLDPLTETPGGML